MVSDVKFGTITADVCCVLCVCKNPFRDELSSSSLVITDSDAENDKDLLKKCYLNLFCFCFCNIFALHERVIQLCHPNIVKTASSYV